MLQFSKFMTAITEHYGEYESELSKRITLKHVKEKFREDKLEQVFAVLTRKFSNRYKIPPDPTVFEEIFGNSELQLEAEALQHWQGINRKVNYYSDIFFEDVRLQAVIEGMGGWVEFCKRPNDPESEKWARKRFIELYMLYSHNKPLIEHRTLRGIGRAGREYTPPVITYGDPERCKKLLSEGTENKDIQHAVANMAQKAVKAI